MPTRLGIEGKLYRNVGTYAAPEWREVSNVRDLTLTLEKDEVDTTSRANAGWKAFRYTLRNVSIEFDMLWDSSDTDLQFFLNAFLNSGTVIECAVLDGPITISGSQGLRASFEVGRFTRNEPMGDVMTVNILLRPTNASNPPDWIVVP